VAYIRALQLSQNVKYDELSAQEKELIEQSEHKTAQGPSHGGEAPSHPK